MVKAIFEDLIIRRVVIIYLDDILIDTSTWAEHLQVLQEVLTCVQRYRLLLQWKKWRWGSMRLHFLEYIISFDGIQMDLEKTEAILKFPCPTIVKQLQRFLDLLTFSLHFIPRLAREGDLFLVDIPVSSLWHGRLGHLVKAGITHLSVRTSTTIERSLVLKR